MNRRSFFSTLAAALAWRPLRAKPVVGANPAAISLDAMAGLPSRMGAQARMVEEAHIARLFEYRNPLQGAGYTIVPWDGGGGYRKFLRSVPGGFLPLDQDGKHIPIGGEFTRLKLVKEGGTDGR
jgi:hypothetical protein